VRVWKRKVWNGSSGDIILVMHGVPKELDLTKIKGNFLSHIAIYQYQVSFCFFEPIISITAEGKWELKDAKGELIDGPSKANEDFDYAKHKAFYCTQVLGKVVKEVNVSPPNSFSLRFETGHVLTFYDDLGPYERINIQPDGIYM
jgi:hypothetical protein